MTKIPYCPNPDCPNHMEPPEERKWFRKKGFTNTRGNGRVQRFQCSSCHRTFSANYYTINHYVHRRISYTSLLKKIVSASGIRDMARDYRCSPSLILNRIQRLSERITAVCSREIKNLKLCENVAADGLESFVLSQYFPTNINILVGHESQFIYYFNSFHFKRKGRCTEEQKIKKEILYETAQFEKGATSNRFKELLDFLSGKVKDSTMDRFILDTDEHRIYQGQFKKHKSIRNKVVHRKTNSKEKRYFSNKLFPCNYIDREIRKDQAEHIRETVQFCRNMNNSMDRFNCYSFWHNFMKPFRINKRKSIFERHAQVAGFSLDKIKETIEDVFDGIRVPYSCISEDLTPFQKNHWEREILNPMSISAV